MSQPTNLGKEYGLYPHAQQLAILLCIKESPESDMNT